MIQITPITVTQNVLAARLSAPTSRKLYSPAICDRFAITMIWAISAAQPPSQPAHGPNAFVVHENVVPQSGSALFM